MVVSGQWLSGEDDDRTSEPRGVQTAIMVHAHDESGEAGERGSAQHGMVPWCMEQHRAEQRPLRKRL